MIFPSYGGIYVPCEVLRSIVQVNRGESGPEYVFRSAISFGNIPPDQEESLHEFLQIQIDRLKKVQEEAAEEE